MSDKGQKVAMTTGGSQGIGASLVTAYRRQGFSVAATAVRDSKDPDGPELIIAAAGWRTFIDDVKAGVYDL